MKCNTSRPKNKSLANELAELRELDATALGILSANPKTFIVSFLTFWYIALSDKGASPALDFAGWFGKTTPSVSLAYALIALAFLTLAQLFHLWELRRKW